MQNERTSLDSIGLRSRIDQSSSGHDYLSTYETILDGLGSTPQILIVGATRPLAFANTLGAYMPKSRILICSLDKSAEDIPLQTNVTHVAASSISHIHNALAGFGPVDLVIEDGSNKRTEKRELLQNLIYHVKNGGKYVIEDLHAIHIQRLSEGGGPSVLDDLNAAWSTRLGSSSNGDCGTTDERLFADAIEEITLQGKLAILTKKGNHAWKVREDEMRTQPPNSHTLSIRGAAPLKSPRTTLSNAPSLQAERLQSAGDYPTVSLRSYSNVIATGGQVYYQGSVVLPDSFRFFTRQTLKNRNLKSLTARVSEGPPDTKEFWSGTFYALDTEFPGHFGHVTTEAISRLWGWEDAKKVYPDLRALVFSEKDQSIPRWHLNLLEAANIPEGDIVVHNGPVRLERLVAATPMFSQPCGAHPEVSLVWNFIGSELSKVGKGSQHEKVFIGRKQGLVQRLCRNSTDVERLFESHGFTVVYPEDFSIADQVNIFRNAHTIAGYGGSGMFNVMFSGGPKRMIVIASEAYDARNEYLISSIIGGDIFYFWCKPDLPHPANGWREAAFMSDFEFDFDKDGERLKRVLVQERTV